MANLGQNQATVTAYLYGPLAEVPVFSSVVPPGTPLAGSVEFQVEGDGHYVTPGIIVQEAGYYTWVESIFAEVNSRVIETTTGYGIAEETTLIKQPPPPPEMETPEPSKTPEVPVPPEVPPVPKVPELPFTGPNPATWWALGLAPVLVAVGIVLVRRAHSRPGRLA